LVDHCLLIGTPVFFLLPNRQEINFLLVGHDEQYFIRNKRVLFCISFATIFPENSNCPAPQDFFLLHETKISFKTRILAEKTKTPLPQRGFSAICRIFPISGTNAAKDKTSKIASAA
jgi:hypothetical protein